MKKLVSVLLVLIMSLGLVCARPFDIYADTWSDHLTGITFSNQKNIVTFTFDTHVLGSFVPEIKFKYTPNGQESTIRPTIRINGTQVSYVIYNDYIYDVTVTKYSSSLQVVSDLDLSGVITILSEMYDNQVDIIANLLEIYGDTTELTNLRQWDIPFESYSINYTLMNNADYSFVEFNNSYFNYPIFNLKQNDLISYLWVNNNRQLILIGLIDKNLSSFDTQGLNPLTDYISFTGTIGQYSSPLSILGSYYLGSSGKYFTLFKVVLPSTGGNIVVRANADIKFIGVYAGSSAYSNLVSTEFALRYGLTNQLIDDVHTIAQGTQQSQSAAGDLEQGTSDLASDISSYNQIESDYNNQMNQALNNIDFSDQFSNNQNFLSGASFVKTVFNSLMQIDILRIFFIVLCIVLIAKRFI